MRVEELKPGELVMVNKYAMSMNIWRAPDCGGSEGCVGVVDHDEVLLVLAMFPDWAMALVYSPRLRQLGWKTSDYLERV